MMMQEKKHKPYILIVVLSSLHSMVASEQKNNFSDRRSIASHESDTSEIVLSKEMNAVIGGGTYGAVLPSLKPGANRVGIQKPSSLNKVVACCCCPFVMLMNACYWCDEYIDGAHDCCCN